MKRSEKGREEDKKKAGGWGKFKGETGLAPEHQQQTGKRRRDTSQGRRIFTKTEREILGGTGASELGRRNSEIYALRRIQTGLKYRKNGRKGPKRNSEEEGHRGGSS